MGAWSELSGNVGKGKLVEAVWLILSLSFFMFMRGIYDHYVR
jgi:hypothetical protein